MADMSFMDDPNQGGEEQDSYQRDYSPTTNRSEPGDFYGDQSVSPNVLPNPSIFSAGQAQAQEMPSYFDQMAQDYQNYAESDPTSNVYDYSYANSDPTSNDQWYNLSNSDPTSNMQTNGLDYWSGYGDQTGGPVDWSSQLVPGYGGQDQSGYGYATPREAWTDQSGYDNTSTPWTPMSGYDNSNEVDNFGSNVDNQSQENPDDFISQIFNQFQ